ncbi:hypothetical protein, partial [Pseudomonas syringae]
SDIAIEKRFRLWAVTMRTACCCVAALIIYQYLRSALMQYTNLTDYRADAPRRHAVLDALRHTAVRRFQLDMF